MSARLLVFVLIASAVLAGEDYKLGPDSQYQEGVPKGTVTKHSWTSKIFTGTTRDYWVYLPAQYDAAKPACVMVFQDGGGFQDVKGGYRVPVVFDNLIHKKEMPVTIGIFINPGVLPAAGDKQLPRYNRSYEYDALGDQYARFLLEEILPEVGKNYNLTQEANGRAICGTSSGGSCAFTAAWERPDAFSRVLSFIGSFTSLRGGDAYPSLIRKMEPKPIRVFLQDGSNDLDIYAGSWFVNNQAMASALKFAGYDYTFVTGDGGHNNKQAGAILPDALRWLWREYPAPVQAAAIPAEPPKAGGRISVVDLLLPGEGWQMLGEGYKFTEGPAADGAGNVFFTDIPNNRIHKIAPDGKISVFVENSGGANGLMFGPDAKLYACQSGKKRIVAYDAAGAETALAEGVESNDLCVSHQGTVYFTDPANKKVWRINSKGEKSVADTGIARPNGILLTPDQGLLIVTDTSAPRLWSFRVEADGSLAHKQPYFDVQTVAGKSDSGADGMTVDTQGRLYVATHAGVQVFDQAGRVNGIISKPQRAWLANVCFGGPELNYLYATSADKVYRRKTKAKGVLSWQAPILPLAPRL